MLGCSCPCPTASSVPGVLVRTQQAQPGCATPSEGHIPVVAEGSGTGIAPSTLPGSVLPALLCPPPLQRMLSILPGHGSSLPAQHCHQAAGALPIEELRAPWPLQIRLCAPLCLLSLVSHSKSRRLEAASCSARSHLLKCRKLAGNAALLHSKSFPMALVTQRSREFKIHFITQHILMASFRL